MDCSICFRSLVLTTKFSFSISYNSKTTIEAYLSLPNDKLNLAKKIEICLGKDRKYCGKKKQEGRDGPGSLT